LTAGMEKVLPAADGLLTVQFGSSHAVVVIQVNGKTIPKWTFVPTASPYTVTFATTSAASVGTASSAS